MPLTRLTVRNEFDLEDPKLYSSNNKDNSKAVLDGVAVAGLVGILRHVGDLAEFAANVFYNLHEEVTATTARGRKLSTRIQNIEAALPSVENSIEQQGRLINFAYVAGFEWHPRPLDDQNVILSSDLPHFMIDSYEACRDAPQLYLLDKFDHAGSGACLKRYSDPSFFRRVLVISELEKAEYKARQKKIHELKKKGSRVKNREMHPAVHLSRQDSRKTTSSPSVDEQNWADNASIPDSWLNPEILSRYSSFASKTKGSYIGQASDVNFNPNEIVHAKVRVSILKRLPDSWLDPEIFSRSSSFASKTKESHIGQASDVNFNPNEIGHAKVPVAILKRLGVSNSDINSKPIPDIFTDVSHDLIQDKSFQYSSSATSCRNNEISPTFSTSFDDMHVSRSQDPNSQYNWEFDNLDNAKAESSKPGIKLLDTGKVPVSLAGFNHLVEVTGETDNYMDSFNNLESEVETENLLQNEREEKLWSDLNSQVKEHTSEASLGAKVQAPALPEKEAPDTLSAASRQVVSPKYSDFCSSGHSEHVQLPHVAGIAQNQEHTDIMQSYESKIDDISGRRNREPFHSDYIPEMGISCTQAEADDDAPVRKSNLKSPLSSMSGLPPVQIWTNGGLFGVDPSKPPDLGEIRVSNEKLISDTRNSDSNLYSCKTDSEVGPLSREKIVGHLFTSSSLSSANGNNPGHVHTLEQCLSLNAAGKTLELSSTIYNNSPCIPAVTKSSVVGLEANDTNGAPAGSTQSIKVISSKFSDLAQRFITNTIQRKSLIAADGLASAPIEITNVREKNGDSQLPNDHKLNAVIPEASQKMVTRENISDLPFNTSTYSNSDNCGQYSPPLEHIKISFCPMNGLESKLQPDVPSGSDCYQGSDDFLLPLFARSKGSVHPCQDSSDSDADTFGRSCPYSSDDLLSPGSCSNSEMWEQEERSQYKDNKLRHDSCRFPSATMSISSNRLEKVNLSNMNVSSEMHNFHSGNCETSLKSRSSAAVSSFGTTQEGCSSLPDNTICFADCTDKLPAPPPLPPVKWIVSKAPVAAEAADSTISNDVGYQNAQAHEYSSQLEDFLSFPNILEERKLNGGSKMGTNVEEQEELLDKIRNKSFRLRPTKTAKPDDLPNFVTNVANANVVAILEKATALRQAFVGYGEEGNDEKWSDG